ncbi:hypothetical protein BpHYR1_020401 [Brachionus plicatilis]|uniref:Uncharacterized protein n=1 Tax=Brachionus plicatilis TaxID=10195 RepID=A0A3M7R7F9_BRAPC|nr:hypothetical protein BpHYR1_020401 [Brachionus plicatilis]
MNKHRINLFAIRLTQSTYEEILSFESMYTYLGKVRKRYILILIENTKNLVKIGLNLSKDG